MDKLLPGQQNPRTDRQGRPQDTPGLCLLPAPNTILTTLPSQHRARDTKKKATTNRARANVDPFGVHGRYNTFPHRSTYAYSAASHRAGIDRLAERVF